MKPYLLLLLAMAAGQSYAAGDCKVKIKMADGTYADSSKYTYTGECKNGYADGKGVYTWSTGGRYEGDFKNGVKDGKGIYSYSDGDRYEGNFKKDSFWGFGLLYTSSGKLKKSAFYIDDYEVKECSRTECDPDYDAYPDLDQKTKTDIVMSKITTAIKEERYKDALPYFLLLEIHGSNLPESFYFYQIQTLSKVFKGNVINIKAQEYLKKFGSKGKYYAEVVEIMGR